LKIENHGHLKHALARFYRIPQGGENVDRLHKLHVEYAVSFQRGRLLDLQIVAWLMNNKSGTAWSDMRYWSGEAEENPDKPQRE
jgi:hypothetical protein